jgi:hypothetical protein
VYLGSRFAGGGAADTSSTQGGYRFEAKTLVDRLR